jgi:hypothetical protein
LSEGFLAYVHYLTNEVADVEGGKSPQPSTGEKLFRLLIADGQKHPVERRAGKKVFGHGHLDERGRNEKFLL